MRKIMTLTLSLLVGVAVLSVSNQVLAEDGSRNTDRNSMNMSESEMEHMHPSDEKKAELDDKRAALKQRVSEKRTTLQNRFQQMKDTRKEELAGKRLELCQKREAHINKLLDQSVERSKKKLAFFQKVESNVENFYTKKNLSSAEYNAAVATANEKAASVTAAIEAMEDLEFSMQKC